MKPGLMIVNESDWDEENIQKCGKHGVPMTEIEEIFDTIPMILVYQNH
ncbi:MAG: hypothetical protein IPL46_05475 [Saprospiraceae bacterium]|nr:hypothetical protein [Saprospiraceae bacterium]